MIYKFRIVSDEVDNFKREICIDSDASFLELHDAILDSVGFSKDQMTSFFICDDDWEKKTEITLMDMGKDSDEDTWIMASTKISDLIEDEGQRLVFVFDYMTDRMFFMELKEIEPGKDLETPVCTRKEGNPPQQTMDFEELEKKNGKEILYQNQKMVLPGDRISKIPRITNRSEPCWVRVKITYADNLENRKGLNDTNLTGMPKYWVKKGAYFYCTRKLEQGESADIFTGVTIPEEWTEPYQEKKLGITIVADAIQAANFSPDFNAMSPWGNQEILRCIHDTNGRVVKRKSQVKLRVVFERDAHKLIAAPEDFFSGFSTAMPGDVLEDSVKIKNATENTAEIFFRTSAECKSVKDQEFLKKLKLVISMDGKKLYSGDLLAVSLNKAVSLGIFQPGKSGEMKFQITVPSELNNDFALRNGDVKWIFSVEEDQKEKIQPSQTPAGQSEKEENSDGYSRKTGASSGKTAPVKTGDDTGIRFFLILEGEK